MQGSNPLINAIAPRLAGTIGSQTDLPASVAVGTIGNTAIRQFFWLKPQRKDAHNVKANVRPASILSDDEKAAIVNQRAKQWAAKRSAIN